MKKSRKDLFDSIRALIGSDEGNHSFRAHEIRKIVSMIGNSEENDKSTRLLFHKRIDGWNKNTTSSHQPSRENLNIIISKFNDKILASNLKPSKLPADAFNSKALKRWSSIVKQVIGSDSENLKSISIEEEKVTIFFK
jgi:hypothetical protein